jgi:hypothetical protein
MAFLGMQSAAPTADPYAGQQWTGNEDAALAEAERAGLMGAPLQEAPGTVVNGQMFPYPITDYVLGPDGQPQLDWLGRPIIRRELIQQNMQNY